MKKRCNICRKESPYVSEYLQVCGPCIKKFPERALSIALNVHKKSRLEFGLPAHPPTAGKRCNICINMCKIPEGSVGYCGLEKSSAKKGKVSWYYDALPTNCVADWVCAGGTGAGYPYYAYRNGAEFGYKNLAVFFHVCSFNCLYCQNWHFRKESLSPVIRSPMELVSYIDEITSCICYFGGDPTPQLPFAIMASRLARKRAKGRILRICWETNGSMNKGLLKKMMELSLDTGGTIKFDIKAWNEDLHTALTAVSNKRTIENFRIASRMLQIRKVPPPVVASTLLVPGYVEAEEVRGIARFIASIDPEIPYSLLAFYPHFYMKDMPFTSRTVAEECVYEAKRMGLKNVKIGNEHLLI